MGNTSTVYNITEWQLSETIKHKKKRQKTHQSEAHIVVVGYKQNIGNCHNGESQLN